ncbi:MAG: hypothetical protein ACRDP7_32345 [Trebonia sp.]
MRVTVERIPPATLDLRARGPAAGLTAMTAPGARPGRPRGRYCAFAPGAVRLLRARGFSARPLEGGLPDWRLAGLPVTTGISA